MKCIQCGAEFEREPSNYVVVCDICAESNWQRMEEMTPEEESDYIAQLECEAEYEEYGGES